MTLALLLLVPLAACFEAVSPSTEDGSAGLDAAVVKQDAGAADVGAAGDAGRSDAAGLDAGAADSGAAPNSGDCRTSSDCPGGTCVELAAGGFRICRLPPVEATACLSPGAPDDCCKTSDCATGKCFETPIAPFCAGVQMQPHNVCASDACKTAKDCSAGELCAPAGVLGFKVARCMPASCVYDSDCTDSAGGRCAPVQNPCCGSTMGLLCVYPGACRSSADCASGSYCAQDGKRSKCVPGAPACPA